MLCTYVQPDECMRGRKQQYALVELSGDKDCVQKHSSTICYYITVKPVCYVFPHMCLGALPNQEISKVQNNYHRGA